MNNPGSIQGQVRLGVKKFRIVEELLTVARSTLCTKYRVILCGVLLLIFCVSFLYIPSTYFPHLHVNLNKLKFPTPLLYLLFAKKLFLFFFLWFLLWFFLSNTYLQCSDTIRHFFTFFPKYFTLIYHLFRM